MVRHTAHRVLSTGTVAQTRVQALAIDARVVVGAVRVDATARNTGATLAQLPGGTGARIATGPALAIRTGLATRTLRVRVTRLRAENARFVALAVRVAALQRLLASGQSVALVSVLAATLHAVIDHGALGTLAALARDGAGVLALVLNAGLVVGAGGIGSAAGLAHAILANQAIATGRVRVANGAACAANATLIGQTVLVAGDEREGIMLDDV